MEVKAFRHFKKEVTAATAAAPVWRFSEYWTGLTERQGREIQKILESKPEIRRVVRDGRLFLIFPTGREWEAYE